MILYRQTFVKAECFYDIAKKERPIYGKRTGIQHPPRPGDFGTASWITETEWTLKRHVAQLESAHHHWSTASSPPSRHRGYLVQDPVRKSYRVGPRLLLLSSTVLSHSDLRSTARPELEKLSATVKETINLSVMLDREIFYLDKVETFRSVVCNTKVGTRAPAHATSGGKIMLAFHDPDYVDAYCRDLPQMQRLTDRTVFSPDLLREQLAQARDQRLRH